MVAMIPSHLFIIDSKIHFNFQYALELRVAKDSILFCDTSFTAQALVKLYLDLYEKHAEGILNTSVQLEDVVSTIELLVSDLQECSRLLKIKPQFEKQQVCDLS